MLLLVATFIYTAVHASLLGTFRDGERLAELFANLFVAFYAFPAFTRSKDRAFLFLAFGAVCFAYGALFSLLLGVRPPATAWHASRAQAQWYYATRYAADVVGLILYAWGASSLARRASRSDGRKV